MRRVVFGAVAGAMLAASVASGGTVVWDEAVDGDLSNFDFDPTPLDFVFGGNSIINGSIGGDSDPNIGDGWDVYMFTVESGESLDTVILDDYVPSGGNTSTGFNVFNHDTNLFLGSTTMTTGDIGTDLLVDAVGGPLGPGNYRIELREFTAPDQLYALTHNLVPAPGAFALLGIAGLTARRRRRA